ncbi:AMP-binding protein [Pelistega sp. MC2]|uniref:AMP-binding protein n=1 Tax=Pelistega sp. MC2 TaxID=1720297 RepID=UPI0008DAF967|nr:AMP-binding protein [Pelistega sp. MC2]
MDIENLGFGNYLEKIYSNLFCDELDKVAIICGDKKISYKECSQNVYNIMSFLSNRQNRQDIIIVKLHKSPEFIFVTLACALMGVIWVPIDMDSPDSRKEYFVQNCRGTLIVSEQSASHFAGVENVNIHSLLQISTAKIDNVSNKIPSLDRLAAYYLYTSGSTGVPKCVVLNRQATSNVIHETVKRWGLNNDDVFIAITPCHHDMSIFDIFAPFSLGATLVVPTKEQFKDAEAWAKLVATNRVSVWVSVPAIVEMLFMVTGKEDIKSLRIIAQGGDYINPSMVCELQKTLPDCQLYSLGGPTETTIWSIWHKICLDDQHCIPYGKPLQNNVYYILDDRMQSCPPFKEGTMYMTGINLSNGYLVDGEIHHQDFVELHLDNDNPPELALKMSDKGYFDENGTIIFCGRDVWYLKVKGTRISALEVEKALNSYYLIATSVVVCSRNPLTGESDLVSFLTLKHKGEFSHSQLRKYLREILPISHIPSKFIVLDKMPLSNNGKVDRASIQKKADELYTKE